MEDVEYIKTRVQNQIDWYDKKASEFKSKHECINTYSIVFTTGGSLFTICGIIFGSLEPWITIIDAIIGVSVAILLSVDKLKKYGELHVVYRRTCESLKRELFLYQTRSSEYQNTEKVFNLFVERCESIMATENRSWMQLNEKKKD